MLRLKPVTLSAALLGTAASAMTLMVAPAQAAQLNGSLQVNGYASMRLGINPSSDTICFDGGAGCTPGASGITNTTKQSRNFKTYSATLLNRLVITRINGDSKYPIDSSSTDPLTSAYYTFLDPAPPFLRLTSSNRFLGDIDFILDNGVLFRQRDTIKNAVTLTSSSKLSGTFKRVSTGDTLGLGNLSINIIRIGSKIDQNFYTLQLTAVPDPKPVSNDPVVPEPLTMLGAGTAVLFGGAFKRQLNKKDKKGSTKA